MTLTPEMVERERLAFEAWAKANGYACLRHGDTYKSVAATVWKSWLARAQSQRADAEVAHLVEEVAKLLSGASFPSALSYAKAREIVALIEREGVGHGPE